MKRALATIAALAVLSAPMLATTSEAASYATGKATYYSPGLMERVAARRHIALGGASGFATYPSCRMLGKRLTVSVLNPRTRTWSAWSVKRIVDCSQTRDYARHVREGLIELSYADARRYGYAGEGRTRIRWYGPY